MATRQVNWLKGQKHFDFTGLSRDQITAKKAKIKAAALVKIKKRLSALGRFKLKSIRWTKETGRPFYYLVVLLNPPAKYIIKTAGTGGGSKITPTPPTVP
jgi:hypothetical protein